MSDSNDIAEEWWVGYVFTINGFIGIAMFVIPWAAAEAGWILAILVQFLACGFSLIASYQVLQAWSRVEVIARLREKGIKVKSVPLLSVLFNQQGNYIEESEENQSLIEKNEIIPQIYTRKFDFCEMTKLTLGGTLSKMMAGMLFLHMVPILVGFTSIFSSSFASAVPIFGGSTCNIYDYPEFYSDCRLKYWSYLLIYSAMMIFLCFFHINEQKWLQIVSMIIKLIVYLLITITCIASILTNTQLSSSSETNANPDLFNIYQIGFISPMLYLLAFNQNYFPTTTAFVKDKSTNLPKIVNASMVTVFALVVVLGIITSYSIESVEKMITLNWSDYSAGEDSDGRPLWCYFIVYMVVLLPAFDSISGFPVVCSSICDNLLSYRYGHKTAKDLDYVRNI